MCISTSFAVSVLPVSRCRESTWEAIDAVKIAHTCLRRSFSEYYYIFSTDGSDWSDPLLVSDSNTLAELSFAGLTYSESLVVAWAEIVEEDDGTLHFNVMSRLADGSGYPNDPKLRVGGIEVWQEFGEYSETQTLEGTEFEQALEQAIMEGTAVEDDYGTPMVLVSFVADVSQFGGSLLFSNLKITYEAELTLSLIHI